MRCAILNDVKDLRFEERDIPPCPADGLRMQVKACGVCATDVKIYNYGHHKIKLPRVLGHELAGVIDEVGADWAGRFSKGQRVAACAVINCGECEFCLRGVPSMCETLEAYGYHFDGGYQEYTILPAKSIRCGGIHEIPEHVSFEEAAVAELAACSLNGQKLSDFRFGESVLVIGSGPVGMIQVMLAHARGCRPIFIADIVPEKLELARRICGDRLAGALDSADGGALIEACRDVTGGRGFDQVMICCGAAAAQQASLDIVAKCGCVNFFGGLPKGKSAVTLDTNHVHYKQCRVVGTHGSSAMDNRDAINLIARGQLDLKPLITDRIALEDLEPYLSPTPQRPDQLKAVVVY